MKKVIIPIPLILFALISCNIIVNKSQNISENSDLSNVE